MSVQDQLEILPKDHRDIGGRTISHANLANFKGLEAQVVHDKDDSYRPYVMDGVNFGGKALMFKDDIILNNGSFETEDYETSPTKTEDAITIDVNKACQFQLDLRSPKTNIYFTDYTSDNTVTAFKKINIYLKFTTGKNVCLFPSNFHWEDNIGLRQLDIANILSQNKAGDMAAFEAFTADSGALWFGRLIGYWSK